MTYAYVFRDRILSMHILIEASVVCSALNVRRSFDLLMDNQNMHLPFFVNISQLDPALIDLSFENDFEYITIYAILRGAQH